MASVRLIRKELLQRDDVVALTGQRIIAGIANYEYEGSVYPYILIHKNGDAKTLETFEGTRVLTEYLIVSCRSDIYEDADSLGNIVLTVLRNELYPRVQSVRELQDASSIVDEEVLFQRQFMIEVVC